MSNENQAQTKRKYSANTAKNSDIIDKLEERLERIDRIEDDVAYLRSYVRGLGELSGLIDGLMAQIDRLSRAQNMRMLAEKSAQVRAERKRLLPIGEVELSPGVIEKLQKGEPVISDYGNTNFTTAGAGDNTRPPPASAGDRPST